MKNVTRGFLLFALAAGMASCSDESPWSGPSDEGGINLVFSSDSRVVRQTRGDDNVSPVVPDANLFGVSLVKSDGSYSKNWTSVEAFNREKSFSIGDYTLSASYGSLDSEGFTQPCYKGSAEVHVSPGAVTEATVVATLANAMVSIRYTDEFIANFKSYSAALQSAGHDWVTFAQTEDRPAYMSPSEIKMNLRLTNFAGNETTIQPASFQAQPRHHYIVTVGVTGNTTSGNLALEVLFSDEVVAETVAVSLGDELFSAPAPEVKLANGFDSETPIEKFEYISLDGSPEFKAFAFGGIASASLTVETESVAPLFGNRVELVNADGLTQQQLSDEGVVCGGFFKNPDKMGVVNIKKFLEMRPAGTYKVILEIKDAMTRVSEPVSLTANVSAVNFEILKVNDLAYMADEVVVDVNSNCPAVDGLLTFKVPDANNNMVNAVVKSHSANASSSNPSLAHSWRYVLDLQPQSTASVDVEATYAKTTKSVRIPVVAPTYTITADAYAKYVILKISAANAAETKTIKDNLQFYNGTTHIPTSNIGWLGDDMVYISGLTPGTAYGSLKAVIGAVFEKAIDSFTTEADTDVTNGTFSNTTSQSISSIKVGGEYLVGAITYQYTSSISYNEPNGWATLNQNTCYTGSNPMNTWFVEPSTYVENGAAVLRTVGYNHSGSVPAKTGSFWSTTYYNSSSPAASDFNVAAGELFLGSYSFNGSESRTDGIAFASRPCTFSFDYSYSPYNNEKGLAYITLYGSGNTVLFEDNIELASGSSSKEVNISSYPFGSKVTKVKVGFKSSNAASPAIYIPSGSELKENGSLTNTKIDANKYNTYARGSVLTIDNVKFTYGDKPSAAPLSKPAKKNRRK